MSALHRTPARAWLGALLAILAVEMVASEARALQPLSQFVVQARSVNNENRRAQATRQQRDAEANAALGNALPSIDLRGILARSQLNPSLPGASGQSAPLIPQNIWLGTAGITVPISVGSWERTRAAKATARSALYGERTTLLDVEREVTRDYYNVVAAEAVLIAAQRGLFLATSNAATVKAMAGQGEASVLDVERVRADVARAEQDVADADGNLLRARRVLRSASGMEPERVAPGDLPAVDDLHAEAPLAAWTGTSMDARPAVAQARGAREAADKSLDAARADWLPTISASAMEVYTNATENLGRKDFYTLLGSATWHLDLAHGPAVSAQHAALDAARAAEAQARIDAEDAVYFAWVQVHTDLQKARSARVEEEAAARTSALARERFAAGEATQIDVLQAQQSYIQASVTRISNEADLAYARAALRLSVSDGTGEPRR